MIYDGTVNQMCARFNLEVLTPDIFRCLISVHWLKANNEGEIRADIPIRLEKEDQCLTLPTFSELGQRTLNLCQRVKKIQKKEFSQLQTYQPEGINDRNVQLKLMLQMLSPTFQ